MNKYFIEVTTYQNFNILDARLQKQFMDQFNCRIIAEDRLLIFKETFEKICLEYKNEGGRAVMEYKNEKDYNGAHTGRICICKGERSSLYITLKRIKGEVQNDTDF